MVKSEPLMATNNGIGNADLSALYARVSERVENQGREIADIRSNMNTGFLNVQASLNAMSNELRDRNKTPWGVLISAGLFFLAVTGAVGALAYNPVLSKVQEVAEEQVSQRAVIVPREELDWRSARSSEERLRVEANISEIRKDMVPRLVWEERNHARDIEVADIKRRLDEMRTEVGSVYGTRDIIQDLKREVDELRSLIPYRGRMQPR